MGAVRYVRRTLLPDEYRSTESGAARREGGEAAGRVAVVGADRVLVRRLDRGHHAALLGVRSLCLLARRSDRLAVLAQAVERADELRHLRVLQSAAGDGLVVRGGAVVRAGGRRRLGDRSDVRLHRSARPGGTRDRLGTRRGAIGRRTDAAAHLAEPADLAVRFTEAHGQRVGAGGGRTAELSRLRRVHVLEPVRDADDRRARFRFLSGRRPDDVALARRRSVGDFAADLSGHPLGAGVCVRRGAGGGRDAAPVGRVARDGRVSRRLLAPLDAADPMAAAEFMSRTSIAF